MIDRYLVYDQGLEFATTFKLKVYKLDEDEEKWVELASLGNRIVFLGDHCTFSVSVSELNSECKGNCLVFCDHGFNLDGDGALQIHGVGVVNLENGCICPVSNTAYSELFWPPPDWFCSDSPIETELNNLSA
nr:F-box protein SKIP23-like [Ipomoea batatas]